MSALIIEVSTVQGKNEKDTCALVDSGCKGYAFIDKDYAKQARLLLVPVHRPFLLYGYNREDKNSQVIREYARCQLRSGNHVDKDAVLYVTELLHYPIILGHPWLKKHNPTPNWAENVWEFNDPYCTKHCNQSSTLTRLCGMKSVPKRYIPKLNYRDIATVSLQACQLYAKRGYKMAVVTIDDIDEALKQEGEEISIQLPAELRDFTDVFSPKKADQLLPH